VDFHEFILKKIEKHLAAGELEQAAYLQHFAALYDPREKLSSDDQNDNSIKMILSRRLS
jgi:hypothetical protein